MTKIIDMHSHFILPEYVDYLGKYGSQKEDGFPMPKWSIGEQFAMMDNCNVEWTMLSISSPHHYFGNDKESFDLSRHINEVCASFKQKYPTRIGFNACLPLPYIDGAIEEAVYALDILNADGIKVASNSRGLYLGDPKLEPLFKELNKRKAIVNIHPHRPTPQQEGIFSAGPVPLFEFLADTTRSVMNMIANGVLERYPDIKFIVPHCGSFLPNIVDRLTLLQPILVNNNLMDPIDIEANLGRLYYDTSGSPVPHMLPLLLTITKPEKVMYGGDFPFTPAPLVKKNLEKLNSFFDENANFFPYKEKILYENAHKLFNRSKF